MKFYLPFIYLIFHFFNGIGQNAYTTKGFLAGAGQDESVIFQTQKFNYLNTNAYNLPLIEKLEFRTNTNEFDIRLQEYSIRISPNSLKNIKTQRQYQKTVQFMTELELEAAWGKALRERYDLLINSIFLRNILDIKTKQKVLYKDKVTLLKRSISLPNFDILELISAEDESQENLRDILDLKNAISTSDKIIQRMESTSRLVQIDDHKLLKIKDIKNILNEIGSTETTNHPQLKVLSARTYSNMLEYEWEAAKSKFSIGFIEAKYGFGPNRNFSKSFSIGMGFDIPLKGSARLDLNELQINVFESESRYRNAKKIIAQKKYSIYQQLLNLIQKHELVNQQLTDGRAEFALKEYSKIAEASPKAMLKLRENTLKKELLQKQLELDIMQTYIEYLDFSGLLGQKPFRNYLSKNLDEF